MTQGDLSGKSILITGASSGIGRACAIACSAGGARLTLLGRDQERLLETLSSCQKPDDHTTKSVELSESDKIEQVVKEAAERSGGFDGVIHAAGISQTKSLTSMKQSEIELFLNVNVLASFLLIKSATSRQNFRSSGGSVVVISSVMANVGAKGKSLYSLTKGALTSTTRSLAVELAPRAIRVNTVSPGVVETPMSDQASYSLDPKWRQAVEKLHPLGIGKAEDVANTCVFLVSDLARWITGADIVVDGGYSAQ